MGVGENSLDVEKIPHQGKEDVGDRRGDRNGHKPGEHDVSSYAPTHSAQAFRAADPHNGGRDNVGGADGHSHMTGGRDYDGRGHVGGETVDWFQFDDFRAHGFDDFPASGAGAEPHGRRAGDHDPEGNVKGRNRTKSHEGHGDHPHAFLGVVGAVAKTHKGGGGHLANPKVSFGLKGAHAPEDPVQGNHDAEGHPKSDKRGKDQGLDDMGDAFPVEASKAMAGDPGTDHPSDEGMATAAGKADIPGNEVPENGG